MEKKYCDYMMEQLKALMEINSPTGYTEEIQEYLRRELSAIGYEPKGAYKGGVMAELGGEGSSIMLLSHVDTLGAVVQYIKPNGRLAVSRVGGLQPNNTETEQVTVITRFDGSYEGTFQLENASAHVRPHEDILRKFNENIEIVLDEHVKTAEDVQKLGICAGDFVAVNPRFTVTKKGFIKSRFLDDKASAAILLAYAKYVKEEGVLLQRNVWINFTVFEEIGKGASCGIPECIRDILAVDMGCVGTNLSCDETMVSICAKDGGGPYHYGMTTSLIHAAKENNINYAVDVYTYYGSDTDAALVAGKDLKHALIGPGVYASHGYERTHIDGLKNTFHLIRSFLQKEIH